MFHRAIAQSGTALVPVPEREDPSAVGFAVGKHFGYHGNDPTKLVHELRNRPAGDVLKAADDVRAALFAVSEILFSLAFYYFFKGVHKGMIIYICFRSKNFTLSQKF